MQRCQDNASTTKYFVLERLWSRLKHRQLLEAKAELNRPDLPGRAVVWSVAGKGPRTFARSPPVVTGKTSAAPFVQRFEYMGRKLKHRPKLTLWRASPQLRSDYWASQVWTCPGRRRGVLREPNLPLAGCDPTGDRYTMHSVHTNIPLRELGQRPLEQPPLVATNTLAALHDGDLIRQVAVDACRDAVVHSVHNWAWAYARFACNGLRLCVLG